MGKSYFSKVTDFYRSSHQGRSVKEGVLRKVFTKLTRKHLCQTGYFNKVCKPKTVKKRLRHKCFPLNVTKFVRTPFLQNTSGRLLLFHRWLRNKKMSSLVNSSLCLCRIYQVLHFSLLHNSAKFKWSCIYLRNRSFVHLS